MSLQHLPISSQLSSLSFFAFGKIGTLLAALTGALIGQESESGFVKGAAVGAISGAVFSIEVFQSSRVLWQSDESGFGCFLYLIGSRFENVANLFDTIICEGMTEDYVKKLAKITINSYNNVDDSG